MFEICSGQPVAFTLPGDVDNPTIFYGEPMSAEDTAVWRALQDYAGRKATELMDQQTAEAGVADAKARVRQQVSILTSRISKVVNSPPDGVTIEGTEAMAEFLPKLAFAQHTTLGAALMDGNDLARLKFRGNPVPGGRGGEEPDQA